MSLESTLLFTDGPISFEFTPTYIEIIHQYDDGLTKIGLWDINGEYVEVYQDCKGRLTSALGWIITELDE